FHVTGVQTCALPIYGKLRRTLWAEGYQEAKTLQRIHPHRLLPVLGTKEKRLIGENRADARFFVCVRIQRIRVRKERRSQGLRTNPRSSRTKSAALPWFAYEPRKFAYEKCAALRVCVRIEEVCV